MAVFVPVTRKKRGGVIRYARYPESDNMRYNVLSSQAYNDGRIIWIIFDIL